jgi:predicted O-methyltransferase YrrM
MTTMVTNYSDLLARIAELPHDWHAAGSMTSACLEAMVRLTGGHIGRSVETGIGKSTLLLSHLSAQHTVFAIDAGNSMSVTRASEIFNPASVEIVDGPTQDTLRAYTFSEPLDFALIDGPHGYPFPEMEYWALYRHIKPGGLLLVDDVQIPTIYSMFQFLREEPMFELVELVGYTAFFRRTEAPTFDPYCDGWYLQPYNTARYPIDVHEREAKYRSPEDAVYRDRLLPLIDTWKAAGTRVAIFGIGPHTEVLFKIVPELGGLNVVAFLDSDPDTHAGSYRGKPIHTPAWAEDNSDLVLCSSFAHELTQMALLDRVNVKVVPSHSLILARGY